MIYDRLFDRLALAGQEREAARRWMLGEPRLTVGQPIGLTNASTVSSWARKKGLPARIKMPWGRREVAARASVGNRIHNARNFGPYAVRKSA